ncbi:TetR/AcrR family transcriptional regulator [Geoglobus ahangari]
MDARVAILEAALRLYTSKPPHAVTMDEVAREAGVSKGTVFYHFGSKDGLEKELVRYSVEKYFSWVFEESRDEEVLERIVRESLRVARENPKLTMLWYYVFEKELFSGNTAFTKALYDEMLGFITGLFEEMGVKRPRETAVVFMAMLDGVYVYSLFVPNLDLDEIGEVIIEFVKGRCRK